MRKQIKCIAAMLVLVPSVGLACEWHGANNFGVFGHMQLPQQLQIQNQSQVDDGLTIDHVRVTDVEIGSDSVVDIKYSAPLRFQKIKVEFEPSDNLKILSDNSVNILNLRGDFPLQFQAESGGKHSILVKVSASENGSYFYTQRRILVNAI
jgi:hypothetical protein